MNVIPICTSFRAISDIRTGRVVCARAERSGCRSVGLRWFEVDRTSTVLMVLFSAGSGRCGTCSAAVEDGDGLVKSASANDQRAFSLFVTCL